MTAHGAAAAMAVLVGTLVGQKGAQEGQNGAVEPLTAPETPTDPTAEVWVAQQPRHDDTTYHDTEDEARATGAALIWRMA